jgi:hypothetical protein
MKFEDLDQETQNDIVEKAKYLIDEGYEVDNFEIVKESIEKSKI